MGTDGDAVLAAMEFLRIHGQERWFLYMHLMDVHEYLYDADSAVFGSDYSSVYDNSILRTNLVLSEFFDFLAQEKHLENTVVVIASDHGEAFGERGPEGHARFVYRESTQVPLILSFPFDLPGGVVVDQPTRNVDIFPTLFDLLGIDGPKEVDGRSQYQAILAAARQEQPAPAEGHSIAHLDQNWGRRDTPAVHTVAVLDDGYRYVRVENTDGSLKEELFNTSEDPAELEDRVADETERAERMRTLADNYLEEAPPWDIPDILEIDEIQLNQLRALGYSLP